MSQYDDTGRKSFTAGGAIAQHLRVKFSSGKLAVAGLTDQDFGTIENAAFADGDVRAVRLLSKQGTHPAVAAGAISQGAKVYGAASGKISATQGTGAFLRGVALEAATADGDVIEILPIVGDTAGS